MGRRVGKDAPVDIQSTQGSGKGVKTYKRPATTAPNIATPAPGPLSNKSNTGGPRFKGGSPLKSPSPTKGIG